jgi:hypothetical protein
MVQFPVRLRYSLSRWQRLVPLLRIHGWGSVLFIVLLDPFFGYAAVENARRGDACGVVFFIGMAAGLILLFRPSFVGLIDVLLVSRREMDVEIEENGAGILIRGERWYLWLDGFTDMRKFRDDTWTLQHWNGWVLHVAASAIGEDVIAHIRAKMEWGRTPEGVEAVVERGRVIQAMLDERRGK